MNTLKVNFEMPESIASLAGFEPSAINSEVRKYLAFFLYEHKDISMGKACELAGISKWEFFEMNRFLKIPIKYSQEDLEYDLVNLKDV